MSNGPLQHPFVILHKVRERLIEPHFREVEQQGHGTGELESGRRGEAADPADLALHGVSDGERAGECGNGVAGGDVQGARAL